VGGIKPKNIKSKLSNSSFVHEILGVAQTTSEDGSTALAIVLKKLTLSTGEQWDDAIPVNKIFISTFN
jgi:hypothetical protein